MTLPRVKESDTAVPADLLALVEKERASVSDLDGEPQLWEAWLCRGEQAARERLIGHYMPYARIVAASYYRRRFHDEIEFDEYLQFASVGLLESVDRFDHSRGVHFKTFAARRMHGAILNGLEKVTEKQQQISVRKQLQAERRESLKAGNANKDGKEGTEALFRELANVGIGLALAYLLEGTGMVDAPEEPAGQHGYYQQLELQQLRHRVRSLVDDLSEQERTVVRCHYLQEMPFVDIAAMLGLSKGRIAQIHRQALERLRTAAQSSTDLDVFY